MFGLCGSWLWEGVGCGKGLVGGGGWLGEGFSVVSENAIRESIGSMAKNLTSLRLVKYKDLLWVQERGERGSLDLDTTSSP